MPRHESEQASRMRALEAIVQAKVLLDIPILYLEQQDDSLHYEVLGMLRATITLLEQIQNGFSQGYI